MKKYQLTVVILGMVIITDANFASPPAKRYPKEWQ